MLHARVLGSVWATVKDAAVEGESLRLIQPLDFRGTPRGTPVAAIDVVGARVGDRVLYVTSSEAALAARAGSGPVDAAIVGLIERIDLARDGAGV